MVKRRLAARVCAVIMGAVWAAPIFAAPCRLALILALDISSSVDATEDAFQRQGVAAALVAPEVSQAILAVPGYPIALSVFEWSGRDQQDLILDWTLLPDQAAIARAAAQIGGSKRAYDGFSTGIGPMLRHAHGMFANGPICDQRVLDVSGDGVHNDGPMPAAIYRRFDFSRITVNGLAIRTTALDHAENGDLAAHYRDFVIHGPGAFVEVADGFEDFARTMERKLIREVQAQIGDLRLMPVNPPRSRRLARPSRPQNDQ